MLKPIIEEHEATHGAQYSAVIWQQVPDGLAEQALHIRAYDGADNAHLLEIQQGADAVRINGETVAALCKLLKRFLG